MKRFFQKLFDWEQWPYDVIYLPVDLAWLYFGIRAGAFWFFTPVNPSLVFAGFEGGSKKEMYSQLPRWSYPTTLYINPGETMASIMEEMKQAGLDFPVAVKPDSGMGGVLFRIIKNSDELKIYHEKVGELYVLQTFLDAWPEFSVFHIRYPGETRGIITGLIVKDYLHVTGTGSLSLEALVARHPAARYKRDELKKKHWENWSVIIPEGEKYILNRAGNHSTGARFVNLNQAIDQQLCDVFDRISQEAGQFYFGRYDLKCPSLEDLKAGKNIQILEYNGAGAAITHVFDRNMRYGAALKEIVRHWRHLYRIGKINHQKGVPYWSFMKGYRFMQKAKRNFKRMREIDKSLN
jgi:hypothetical protein